MSDVRGKAWFRRFQPNGGSAALDTMNGYAQAYANSVLAPDQTLPSKAPAAHSMAAQPALPIAPTPAGVLPQAIFPSQPESPPPLSETAMKRGEVMRHLSMRFGDIIALLLQSARYRTFTLGDLEWLVLPALSAGQFAVIESQDRTSGSRGLLSVALWAWVSPEVHARLETDAKAGKPVHLTPQEWTSGNKMQIILAAGEKSAVEQLLNRMSQTKRPDASA